MSKIIVTGGAGFIGSQLVDELVRLKHDVIVIDDLSTGKLSNLKKSKDKIKIQINKLTLRSKLISKPPRELLGTDYIFHLAALPRIERSIIDPIGTHKANVEGTLAILELARKLKVKKVIYTSSSSVYGIQKKLPLDETLSPNPQNPYAFQKLIGEYYCQIFNQIYGIPVVVFRLFNVYGPRMLSKGSYKLVFTKWLEQKKLNQPLSIYGDGKQTRDFTYISDVISGLISVLDKKINSFEIFNLGGGNQTSVITLSKLFNHPTKDEEPRKFEEKFKQADITKIKKILNWKPSVSVTEGVEKLLEYYK